MTKSSLVPAVALTMWCLSVFSSVPAIAARVDLLDFVPIEPGAIVTLSGTRLAAGKDRRATATVKVQSFDGFGKLFTSVVRYELIAGSQRMISVVETEFDHRVRITREEHTEGKYREVHTYLAWNTALPRIVEIGKTYPVNERYEGAYGEVRCVGTMHITIESVPTDLGTFECLFIGEEMERTIVPEKRKRQTVSETWLARGVGPVRLRQSITSDDGVSGLDLIIKTSSRPVEFKPVVIAVPH